MVEALETAKKQLPKKNLFLIKNKENADYNQYWYSQKTINFIIDQIKESGCQKVAFLSTPSIYFTLDVKEPIRNTSYVFEYDKKFSKDKNFVFYDFNKPSDFPAEMENYFDFIVIDPPFITREVWEKYALTGIKIAQKNEKKEITAKFLLTSIPENAQMLKELLQVEKKEYKPLIQNLVYQYNFFANYDSEKLNEINEEIGF